MHDYDVINRELARYSPELAKRPQIVALSKMDVTETREASRRWREKFAARGITLHAVSAATGEGVKELLEALVAGIVPAARPFDRPPPGWYESSSYH